MMNIVFLGVLGLVLFQPVKYYEKPPHPLLIIQESGYHSVEYPELFGIKPKNPGVQPLDCRGQMAQRFIGAAINPLGCQKVKTKQETSLRGTLSREE